MSGKSGGGIIAVVRTFSLRDNDAQTKSLWYNMLCSVLNVECSANFQFA